jgi:hypothetical protein
MCAVDCTSATTRDKIVAAMRKEGVHLGVCGEVTLRFVANGETSTATSYKRKLNLCTYIVNGVHEYVQRYVQRSVQPLYLLSSKNCIPPPRPFQNGASDSPTERQKTGRRMTERRMTERRKTGRRMTERRKSEHRMTEHRMTETPKDIKSKNTEHRMTERRIGPNVENEMNFYTIKY